MKKILTLIALSLGMAFAANAESSKQMRIALHDGSSVTYAVSALPVITFAADNLVVTAYDASAELKKASVKDITFVEPSELVTLTEKSVKLHVFVEPQQITVNAAADAQQALVFNLNGQLVASAPWSGGQAVIPLSANGVFIVKAGSSSIKIVK